MKNKDQILLENLYSEMTLYPLFKGSIFIFNDNKMVSRFENKNREVKHFYILTIKYEYPWMRRDQQPIEEKGGEVVASANNLQKARNIKDKKDNEYGAYVHFIIGQYDDNTFARF